MKIQKERLMANLGVRIVDDQPTGERTPSGLIRGPEGTLMPPASKAALRNPRQEQAAPQEPVPEAPPAKGRKRKQAPPVQATAPEPLVRMKVTVPGLGTVPTEYRHMWTGRGVVVLGLTDMSYMPPAGTVDDEGNVSGVIELSSLPGERLVYSGEDFYDGSCRNLVMLRLGSKRKEVSEDDDEQAQ